EEFCSGCDVCRSLCPFLAIEMVAKGEGKTAKVIEAMCQGCGLCAAACPSGAVRVQQFTDRQLLAQVQVACKEPEGGS
ncbi:4Fe-4S binding protein, partial [Candidatus Bathyarchaeota archaeon]|nr:4Fe-4S binding protein [Candidatus Bathyarchaeota archaeon]